MERRYEDMKRAMFRVWGKEGHRQKASWMASVSFTCKDGVHIETWGYDRTGSHEYVDIEFIISDESCTTIDDELDAQLYDGVFECCNVGKIERLKYTYYWTTGLPTSRTFNNFVYQYEKMLNEQKIDGVAIPSPNGNSACYVAVFTHDRFTMKGVKRYVIE